MRKESMKLRKRKESQQFQINSLSFIAQFLKINLALQLYKLRRMQFNQLQLFSTLIKQFEQKLNIDQTFNEAQQLYFLKEFKLEKICSNNTVLAYAQQAKKYAKGQIDLWSDQWHKNQRKLFIEFLICYCKLKSTTPQNVVRNILQQEDQDWNQLSLIFFGKNPNFLKFQALSIIKNLRKNIWSLDDDQLIMKAIRVRGQGNWNLISKSLYYNTNGQKYFAPKQIRERWYNHLNDKLKKNAWSPHEDKVLLQHVLNVNKRWCEIVKELKYTRTQHMIKNRYKFLTKLSPNSLPTKEQILVKKAINKTKKKILALKKSTNPSVHTLNKNVESSVGYQFKQKNSSQVGLSQIKLIKNSGDNQDNNSLAPKRNILDQEVYAPFYASNSQQLELFGLYFPVFSQGNSGHHHIGFSSSLISTNFLNNHYNYPQAVLCTEGINNFDHQYLLFTPETYLPVLSIQNGTEEQKNGDRNTVHL